jgi:hypothetical protein
MDLANMLGQGVHHLIAYCLNDSCRHQALIEVSKCPGSRRHSGAVTPIKGEVREVRSAWPAHRRAAKLERAIRYARQLGRAVSLGKVMGETRPAGHDESALHFAPMPHRPEVHRRHRTADLATPLRAIACAPKHVWPHLIACNLRPSLLSP